MQPTEKLKQSIECRIAEEKSLDATTIQQICFEEITKGLEKTLIALQFVARTEPDTDAGAVCKDAFEDFCQNVAIVEKVQEG